jgi:hypothetical protein
MRAGYRRVRGRLHRGHHDHRRHWRDHEHEHLTGARLDRRIARLEAYQRELEQEVADVASAVKRLREQSTE